MPIVTQIRVQILPCPSSARKRHISAVRGHAGFLPRRSLQTCRLVCRTTVCTCPYAVSNRTNARRHATVQKRMYPARHSDTTRQFASSQCICQNSCEGFCFGGRSRYADTIVVPSTEYIVCEHCRDHCRLETPD